MRRITTLTLLLLVLLLLGATTSHAGAVRLPAPAAASRIAALAAAPAAQSLEQVGQIPGFARAMAVHGNLAAMVSWGQFALFNIADPSHPRTVSYLTMPEGIQEDVALDGTHAYIAGGQVTGSFDNPQIEGQLRIVDIANPTAPVLIGALPIPNELVFSLAVAGNYAYLQMRSRLQVVDISNPAAPKLRGSLSLPRLLDLLHVGGANIELLKDETTGHLYAIVADSVSLLTIDVSNPDAPVRVGSATLPQSSTRSVALNSSSRSGASKVYAYVTDAFVGLRVVDVTDVAHPLQVGVFSANNNFNIVVAFSHYALVSVDTGLLVVDVADASKPVLTGSYTDTVQTVSPTVAFGHYAMLADYDGISIIDVAQPNAPVAAGSYKTLTAVGTSAVSGRYLFVPVLESLEIMDVSNPATPVHVGSAKLPNAVRYVALAGHYALVPGTSATQNDVVSILDVADPAAPKQVGSYDAGSSTVMDITITGVPGSGASYAYISTTGGTMHVLDLNNPAAPTEVGNGYLLPGKPAAVVREGNYLYATVAPGGLIALDISNPTQIKPAGTVDIESPSQIAIAGHYAYVVAPGGLQIVDIANPAALKVVGGYAVRMDAIDGIAAAGNDLYISGTNNDYYGTFLALDISDPTAPKQTSTAMLPGSTGDTGIMVANGLVFVNANLGGVAIFRQAAAAIYTNKVYIPVIGKGQ